MVLVAYPPSRPYALFDSRLGLGRDGHREYTVGGVAASLAFALGAGCAGSWLLRRGLRAASKLWILVLTLALAWCSVTAWAWAFFAFRQLVNEQPIRDRLENLPVLIFFPIALPQLAFSAFWEATWILLPLSFVTVWGLSRLAARSDEALPPLTHRA
jgi:hypothetical protein